MKVSTLWQFTHFGREKLAHIPHMERPESELKSEPFFYCVAAVFYLSRKIEPDSSLIHPSCARSDIQSSCQQQRLHSVFYHSQKKKLTTDS